MEKVTSIGSPVRSKRRRSSKPSHGTAASVDRYKLATRAYELRVQGKSFTTIAEILGMSNADDVHRLFAERYAFDAGYLTDMDRKSILAMELIRLDALQDAVWESAMMGDPKSVDSALRVIQTRAKIIGLEQVDPVNQKNLVLVMGDKEQDYIDQLKAVGANNPGKQNVLDD